MDGEADYDNNGPADEVSPVLETKAEVDRSFASVISELIAAFPRKDALENAARHALSSGAARPLSQTSRALTGVLPSPGVSTAQASFEIGSDVVTAGRASQDQKIRVSGILAS